MTEPNPPNPHTQRLVEQWRKAIREHEAGQPQVTLDQAIVQWTQAQRPKPKLTVIRGDKTS